MADLPEDQANQNVSIYDKTSGIQAEVTSENRLKVESVIDLSNNPRFSEPVNEYGAYSTIRNKINYTVPVGKRLWIVQVACAFIEGKIFVEFQADGNPFTGVGLNETGDTSPERSVPLGAPYGPFAAGVTIRARREDGDSGKEWDAEFVGYLENV